MALIFVGAKQVDHPRHGKCRAELWKKLDDENEHKVEEPRATYETRYEIVYYRGLTKLD